MYQIMITTVIFDIGMVLADFHWRRYIASFGWPKETNERIEKATVLGPYWNEIDRGVMGWQEIIDSCIGLAPDLAGEIHLFFERIENIITEFPYSAQWIRELKEAGYRVYLLSNYGEVLFGRCQEKFSFLKETDGGVISYTVKKIKPDPEIYRILLERYQINPGEAVFIDDLETNIRAAEALGIHGIVFRNRRQAQKELEKLGVRRPAPDSIIFDLDGTLWDSTQAAAAVWQQVVDEEFPDITDRVTAEKLKSLYGLPLEEIAVKVFEHSPAERALEAMWVCVKRQCPYLAEHGAVMMEGVKESLAALKKRYRLFIVSNCQGGYIEAFLEGEKLGEFFEDFECPGRTGKLKAANIRLIMERHGLKRPIYVGDTAGDQEASDEAGVPFIFAAYGFGHAKEYDARIDSFQELVTLFEPSAAEIKE